MLFLALIAVLSQTGPKCVTTGSTRVCGYDCAENGATAQCAQTPSGVCGKNSSAVLCFDPGLWLTPLYPSIPRPACISEGGNIACGYDCKREGGKASCAQTPKGACVAQYGSVFCVDPPPEVYAVLGADVPPPTCKAQEGKVACGYACVSGGGKLSCAKTPFGTCAENGSAPQCFDPDKTVICSKGKSTPKPECVSASGRLVCGYHCATAGAEVACAKTPDGTCDTAGPGKPVCFDPPVRGGSSACLEAAASSR